MSEEQVQTAEQEQQEGDDPPDVDPQIEARARELGWKPQEDWDDSRPGEWMPADEFVKRQERLREKGDHALQKELARIRKELADQKTTTQRLVKMSESTYDRAYAQARKDIEEKQRKAVEDGDVAAFDAAKSEMDKLDKEHKAGAEKGEDAQADPDSDPQFVEFRSENPWYADTSDPENMRMTTTANRIAKEIAGYYPGPTKEFYDMVAKLTLEEHGGGKSKRAQPAAVESGAPAGKTRRGKGWADLPPEAKEVGERFIRQGLFEEAKDPHAAYAKEFFESVEE